MKARTTALLVGGSDLFSGMRGISAGTVRIREAILPWYDEVHAINYNYFLDFGRALRALQQLLQNDPPAVLCLYGYSKGGDVVLQLTRLLERTHPVALLVTIDVANGPWSHRIDRHIPANVQKTINVYQRVPNLLRSHGAPAFSESGVNIRNIDLTGQEPQGKRVSHGNIEDLMVPEVIDWLTEAVQAQR